MSERPIQVNRAPILALWATVVAEALGHPPDTAVTRGRYVTSASAHIKARGIGMLLDKVTESTERLAQVEALIPGARNDDSSIISGAWYRARGCPGS
jgi:hypothetical protein